MVWTNTVIQNEKMNVFYVTAYIPFPNFRTFSERQNCIKKTICFGMVVFFLKNYRMYGLDESVIKNDED